MTELEMSLVNCQWCWQDHAFTTVKNGHGFVVYRDLHQMWLAGLTKEVTDCQLKIHRTEPPHITGFWSSQRSGRTPRMFEIPATPELVSAVLFSTFPELQRLPRCRTRRPDSLEILARYARSDTG